MLVARSLSCSLRFAITAINYTAKRKRHYVLTTMKWGNKGTASLRNLKRSECDFNGRIQTDVVLVECDGRDDLTDGALDEHAANGAEAAARRVELLKRLEHEARCT